MTDAVQRLLSGPAPKQARIASIILVIALAVLIYPKDAGEDYRGNMPGEGFPEERCSCLGVMTEKRVNESAVNAMRTGTCYGTPCRKFDKICYGIPYSCYTYTPT